MHRTLVVLSLLVTGCALKHPELAPLQLATVAAPPPLEEDHFARDRLGLGEPELRQILAAPVFLEERARIGVLPVRTGYAPDEEVPVESAPATLADTLEGSGLFELASEISTEWPTASGTAGLRELAARYRTEYVLLYRHRFADATRPNGFAVGFLTLIGALFLPGTTLETRGVLEATLFDVKTGTILFTVHERVAEEAMVAPPAAEVRLQRMHRALVQMAAKRLADQVVLRCQRLVASRPAASAVSNEATSSR